MTEAEQQPQTAEPAPSLGQLLRQAREAKGLSTASLAQLLNLDLRLVDAIEREDFSALPSAPYVRGYLRAWARELGVDEDALLAAYARAGGEVQTTPYGELPEEKPHRRWVAMVVLVALLLLAAGGVYYFIAGTTPGPDGEAGEQAEPAGQDPAVLPPQGLGVKPQKAEPQKPEPQAAPVPAMEPPPAQDPVAGTPPQRAAEPVVLEVEAEARPTPAASPARQMPAVPEQQEPAPQAAQTLALRAQADSWVEVRDAEDRRLYYDLLHRGDEKQFSGVAPYRVFLGNAPMVRVEFDGERVDTKPFIKANKTARLTVGEG